MLLTSTTGAANNLKFAKPSRPENFFRYHLVIHMLVDDKSLFKNTLYFCLEVIESEGFQSCLPIFFSLINISKCKRNKLISDVDLLFCFFSCYLIFMLHKDICLFYPPPYLS